MLITLIAIGRNCSLPNKSRKFASIITAATANKPIKPISRSMMIVITASAFLWCVSCAA